MSRFTETCGAFCRPAEMLVTIEQRRAWSASGFEDSCFGRRNVGKAVWSGFSTVLVVAWHAGKNCQRVKIIAFYYIKYSAL